MSENQSTFDVLLVKPGSDRISVMKVIMELTSGGLKQSKDLMDNAPNFVLTGVSYERAAAAVIALENAGAQAEMQRVIDLDSGTD